METDHPPEPGAQPPRRRRRRRRVFAAITLLGVGALGLVFLEGFVRVAFPRFDPRGRLAFVWNPARRLGLGPPDTKLHQWENNGEFDVRIAFNRHGLRDVNDVSEARPGDLLVVGDSFTFGWGVEERERYSSLLAERLGRKTFNVAVPTDVDGYQQLLRLAQDAGSRARDVVLGLCMDNDVRPYAHLASEKHAPPAAKRGLAPGLKSWLLCHSALYSAFTSWVHASPSVRHAALRLGLMDDRSLVWLSTAEYSAAAIEQTVARLSEVLAPYRATVLIIPSRALWSGDTREAADRIHRETVAGLRRAGLAVVDVRPLLEANGDPLGYYFREDGHWTAEAHALAAEALARRLRAHRR